MSRKFPTKEEVKLIPLKENTTIYAFFGGSHYHLSKNCPMLTKGQFEKYGYKKIRLIDIKMKRLTPCKCATEGGLEEFKRILGVED